MAAPKKIYVKRLEFESAHGLTIVSMEQRDDAVEYIQADAFIEKACEYIITHIPDMHTLGVSAKMDDCIIKDFRNYMKEE